MNLENLMKLDRPQLVELALKHNIKPHHKAKIETIAKQIIEVALKVNQPTVETSLPIENKEPAKVNTIEEVQKVLESVKSRQPRFHDVYDAEEQTWHFMWKNDHGKVMREECGNMSVPLRIIKQKADQIAQGPVLIRALNQHFDQTTAGGNNAYTNTVLA